MKNSILILAALASVTIATYSARPQESQDDAITWRQVVETIVESSDAAKLYINSFYETIGEKGTMVLEVSPFKPRMVKGVQYIVSKEFVGQDGQQGVLRVVVRVDASLWTKTMAEGEYQVFLRTGNFQLPNLTVD